MYAQCYMVSMFCSTEVVYYFFPLITSLRSAQGLLLWGYISSPDSIKIVVIRAQKSKICGAN